MDVFHRLTCILVHIYFVGENGGKFSGSCTARAKTKTETHNELFPIATHKTPAPTEVNKILF